MLGFIKKDLLVSKSNLKIYLLMLLVYILLSLNGDFNILFVVPFLSTVVVISSFSFDEASKWNMYAVTLPKGRKNIVKSKYLVLVILYFLTSIISILLAMLISYFTTKSIPYLEIFLTTLYMCVAVFIIHAIIFPFIFKFGIEKARFIIFGFIFAFAIVVGLITSNIDLSFINEEFEKINLLQLNLIVSAIGIISYYLSYLISKRIILKKEY